MAPDDAPRRQPLGIGRADIVFIEHFQHRAAHHAREDGRESRAQGCRRQHDGQGTFAPADGQPFQAHGEDQDQHRAHHEIRNRHPHQRHAHGGVVPGAVLAHRGKCAQRECQGHRDRQGDHGQLYGGGNTLQQQLAHGPARV